MATAKQKRELDLSAFPQGSVTEYSTLVCLACTFDIFTTQLGLAPRTAYSEIKKYSPTVAELTAPRAIPPFFDCEEKHPHCPYCTAARRWHARFETTRIEGDKATDVARRKLIKALPQGQPVSGYRREVRQANHLFRLARHAGSQSGYGRRRLVA